MSEANPRSTASILPILRRWHQSWSRAAAALLATGLCAPAAAQHGAVAVQVGLVEKREVAPTLELVGVVTPDFRTQVAAEVGGLVVELPVDVGDRLKTGDVIARLRNVQRNLAFEIAQARVAEARALLGQREAELKKAEFESKRTKLLWESQQSSEKEYIYAQADLESAQRRVEEIQRIIAAGEATVARFADELDQATIRAPLDGYVVKKSTEVGSWIDQGQAVAEMAGLDRVRVRTDAPESIVAFCAAGENVGVKIDALGKTFNGKIGRVNPDGDPQAHTFPVEIDIENPDGALKAGMFARVQAPSGPKAARLLVPKDAVLVRGPASLVFVIREAEGKTMAMPLPIRPVSEVLDQVAVEAEGLAAGDRVVVRGNEKSLFGPTEVWIMPGESEKSEVRSEKLEARGRTDSEDHNLESKNRG